jgi:hypothetical protein
VIIHGLKRFEVVDRGFEWVVIIAIKFGKPPPFIGLRFELVEPGLGLVAQFVTALLF